MEPIPAATNHAITRAMLIITFRPFSFGAPFGFGFPQVGVAQSLWVALDLHAWFMHDPCMATKTISIETDAYDLLKGEKHGERESFSQVVRRLFAERPVLTAGELAEAMKSFEGKGAGKRRTGRRAAA